MYFAACDARVPQLIEAVWARSREKSARLSPTASAYADFTALVAKSSGALAGGTMIAKASILADARAGSRSSDSAIEDGESRAEPSEPCTRSRTGSGRGDRPAVGRLVTAFLQHPHAARPVPTA